MATALQLRRGTTAQNNSFTGAAGELSYDTATEGLRVHDGSTAGGFEILPSGSILPFGGTSAPTAAFLLCDGSDVSRTTYARLFAVIGTAYGAGNGSSTFGLPDLRDRVPLGKGSNNSTLGAETGSAAASSVITNATSTTGTSNTGTGTTGTANTGTGTSGSTASTTGTGTTGTGTTGTGTTGTATSGSRTSTTGTGTTGTGTTGTGTTGSTTAGRTNTTGTFATSAKDSATGTALTDNVNAAHTHTIPGLSIPALATTLPSSVVNFIIKI